MDNFNHYSQYPYAYGYPVAPNQPYPPPPPQNQPFPSLLHQPHMSPPQNQPNPPPLNQPYPPLNQPYPPPPPQYQQYPLPIQSYPPPPAQHQQYPGAPYDHNYTYPYPAQPGPAINPPNSEYSFPQPSQSSPVAYPYHQHSVSPEPSLQHQSSLQYGSNNYHHQHSRPLLPPPENHSHVPLQDNESNGSGSTTAGPEYSNNHYTSTSTYPPIEDSLSHMQLSSNQPSAPASMMPPSAPSHYSPSLSSLSLNYSGAHYSPSLSSSSLNYSGAHYGPSLSDSSLNYSGKPPPQPYLDHSVSYVDPSQGQNLQVVPFSPTKGSLKVLLLHGNLDIWIYDAKNLPNMDMFHKTMGDLFGKLPGKVSTITSDPYVSISVTTAVIGRTYVIPNSENPVWMQHFYVPVAHYAAEVHFVVKDDDVVGSQLIGIVSIPVEKIYSGGKVEGHFPIINTNGKPCKPGAQLSLSIQYTPMERLSIYHYGVGAGPDYHGVPGTYFPLRRGGTVTLYQDAHVVDDSLPKLKLEHDMPYVHGKCWHDIFDAIRQAQRLIYITGWSVWHKVQLVRDPSITGDSTLGELLKAKSQEGVQVLLLIWDDPTSRSIMGYKTDGLMQTHDEETRRFFKHSSVQVLLCPRAAGKRHSWVKQTKLHAASFLCGR